MAVSRSVVRAAASIRIRNIPLDGGGGGGGIPVDARYEEDAAGTATDVRYEEDGVTVRQSE